MQSAIAVDGTAVDMIQVLKLEPRIMRYELSEVAAVKQRAG